MRKSPRRSRVTVIPVLFFAACGGAAPPPEAPKAAAPTCASTAGHMVDALAAGMDPRPPDATVNELIALIRTRCEQDAWSAEALGCLSTMASAQDADRCGTLLTDEQQAALLRDQQEKFGAMGDPTATKGVAPPPPAAEAAGGGAEDAGQEEGKMGRREAAPASAPPAPARRSKSSAPSAPAGDKKMADPCDGGE